MSSPRSHSHSRENDEEFLSSDLRPVVPHSEDAHAHHIHEFGEVDIVHVERKDSSGGEEEQPVVPVTDQSPKAKGERWHRLGRRLFRERHLMQYFYNDTLYRTVGVRKVSTEELFLDLVIVAAIAALGHELRESEITWLAVEKFLLLFTAVYSSWRENVICWNLWGAQQDLGEKIGIYATFLALTGIALGAHSAFDDLARPYVAVSAFFASAIPAGGGIIWSFRERLLKNPANRVNQLQLSEVFTFFAILPYLVAAFVKSSDATRSLYWLAFSLQTLSIIVPHKIYQFLHRKIPNHTRMAVNIELLVEKYDVLTMIVLGETMIGLLFEGGAALTQDGVRVGIMYLSAAASTAMLYSFQTLYIQVDSPIDKGGKHAIRHNVWSGYVWGLLHMPYHFNLILFATGLSISFRDVAVPPKAEGVVHALIRAGAPSAAAAGAAQFTRSARWTFSTGWGGSMIFSAIIGALHRRGPRSATKVYRTVFRCIVTVAVMVGMPFSNLSAGLFQGVFAAVTVAISIAEFLFVQMDRIGFFRSEKSLRYSSTESGGKSRLGRYFFDDSASESSEMDPALDTEMAKAPLETLNDIDLESGPGDSANLIALKKRMCKDHSARTRLVPVQPKAKDRDRLNQGFG